MAAWARDGLELRTTSFWRFVIRAVRLDRLPPRLASFTTGGSDDELGNARTKGV